MNTEATSATVGRLHSGARPEVRRYFHIAAATIMLGLMLAGFWPFYVAGEAAGGRQIDPSILPLVVTHGLFMTAWVLVFLSQAMLIAGRRVRWHRVSGWCATGIALGVALSALAVAIASVRLTPEFTFLGMPYPNFLFIMLAEAVVFAALAGAGVAWRKRREAHRAMMLMATLSIIAGATVRIPALVPVFGAVGWWGLFGPAFTLGAVFLVVHSVLMGALDRWMAGAWAFMVIAYVAAGTFAVSDTWSRIANALFGV